jgi:hypothetical protein
MLEVQRKFEILSVFEKTHCLVMHGLVVQKVAIIYHALKSHEKVIFSN